MTKSKPTHRCSPRRHCLSTPVCPRLFVAAAVVLLAIAPSRTSADAIGFSAEGLPLVPGSSGNQLYIHYQNTSTRQGVHLTVSFDPSQIRIEGVQSGERVTAPLVLETTDRIPSELGLMITDPTSARGGLAPVVGGADDRIAHVVFGVPIDAPTEETIIRVTGALVADSLLHAVSPIDIEDFVAEIISGIEEEMTMALLDRSALGVTVRWQFSERVAAVSSFIERSEMSSDVPAKVLTDVITGRGPHSFTDSSKTAQSGVGLEYRIIRADVSPNRVVAVLTLMPLDLPERLAIKGPYPNPVQTTAQIQAWVPTRSHVNLDLYNVAGRRVSRILDEVMAPGRHSLEWGSVVESKQRIPSGVYFLRLQSNGDVVRRRVLVVR